MSLSADRLRLIQEIYSESLSFSINKTLPETVIGQCIVSYRKFVDFVIARYGIDSFHLESAIDTCIVTKPTHSGKDVYGIRYNCLSIVDAIRVSRLALKRSSNDFFAVNVKMFNLNIPVQILSYAAKSKRPIYDNCTIVELASVRQAKNNQI